MLFPHQIVVYRQEYVMNLKRVSKRGCGVGVGVQQGGVEGGVYFDAQVVIGLWGFRQSSSPHLLCLCRSL